MVTKLYLLISKINKLQGIYARIFTFLGGQKIQKEEKTGYLPIFAQKMYHGQKKT